MKINFCTGPAVVAIDIIKTLQEMMINHKDTWCLTKIVVKYRTLKIQQVRSATLEYPKYDQSI